jgi:glyoxylase-like metal-dependent hydrolase (beta-lactamase superfamily II)
VGRRRVAVVDPGPDQASHVEAVADALRSAETVSILLTHGHEDHAGAAPVLAARVGAEIRGPAGLDVVGRALADGARVETDMGPLVAVHTPGHTADHLGFHWPGSRALFAGDLLLGRGDTTWVADYPGCVADYLRSLERLRGLDLAVVYPAHGPPLHDVPAALDRFERHRRERIAQVERALEERPEASLDDLLETVYGDSVPAAMRPAALRSLEALVEHVRKSPDQEPPRTQRR